MRCIAHRLINGLNCCCFCSVVESGVCNNKMRIYEKNMYIYIYIVKRDEMRNDEKLPSQPAKNKKLVRMPYGIYAYGKLVVIHFCAYL